MEERRYSSWMLERVAIGDTVRLRLGTSTIGRHSSSVIRILDSAFVSRYHGVIEVSEDNSKVTLKDVSSNNGIYINGIRHERVTVELKSNDLIGIGVTTDDFDNAADVLKLPIYELKYAPIRPLRLPSTNKPATTAPQTPPVISNKDSGNNSRRDDEKPSSSNSIKVEKLPITNEIFEISDDDDDLVPKCNNDVITQQKAKETGTKCNDKTDEFIKNVSKQIDLVIKNEPNDVKDYINPSQKSQEKQKKEANLSKDEVSKEPGLSNEVIICLSQKSLNDSLKAKEESSNDVILSDETKSIVNDKDTLDSLSKSPKAPENCLNDVKSSTNNDLNSSANPLEKSLNDNLKVQDLKKEDNPTNLPTSNETSKENEEKEPVLHTPIISTIKKELLRSVSNDIENIFGDINGDDELKQKIKEINPLVYNEMHASNNLKLLEEDQQKMLSNGDYIVLTDDDDVEIEELGTITPLPKETKENEECTKTTTEGTKSPNIFDTSLDNSKGEEKIVEDNEANTKLPESSIIDNIDLDVYTKYSPNSDDEDIEDLMFSQIIMNDMKAELQDDLEEPENLPFPDNNIDNNPVTSLPDLEAQIMAIKQEPGLEIAPAIPKELENSCWIVSDDEDYDEELETKVNDWSNKIFSQSFNLLSQSMSQVYDTQEPENDDAIEEEYDDDNLSLLEDDIDGIASIYNNNLESEVDKEKVSVFDQLKEVSNSNIYKDNKDPKEVAEEQYLDDQLKKASEALDKNKEKVVEKEEKKKDKRKSEKTDGKLKAKKKHKEKDQQRREKSPEIVMNNSNNQDVDSPVVRVRRLSKTNPVPQSPSSSENEFELDNDKPIINEKVTDAVKPTVRLPPPVIDAPSLPKHKGKLRGVSAEIPKKLTTPNFKSPSVQRAISSIKEKLNNERYNKDLKRKWLEKPSIAKRRDKEHKKFIKECRKDKLKELAERKKSPSKENIKRKMSTDDHEHKAKMAKVKNTTHNRGAFLVNNDPTIHLPPPATVHGHKTDQKNQFKIPKVLKKPEETKKPKESPTRSLSIDGLESFAKEISKPDELLLKRQNSDTKKCEKTSVNHNIPYKPPPVRRHSVTERQTPSNHLSYQKTTPTPATSPICKEAIAARAVRTTNKITFASMEKNIVESEQNKQKLCVLSSNCTNTSSSSAALPHNNILQSSNLKNPTGNIATSTVPSNGKKKKTVRFNDTPVIHYIERIMGACKKINNKDIMPMTSYRDRRLLIRSVYPIIDQTDVVISKILSWSNEWLIKRNANADAAGDIIFPMPTHFNSFDHYKSIIFPLMKLEFISVLEREYNMAEKVKRFKVSLEYATHNKDRIMLITKFCNNVNKELTDSSLYDLVLLNTDQRGPQIFAYAVGNRKGAGPFNTIVYEIIAKNYTVEYFKAIKELHVRPVMDKVRVHFGSFNSVYQLQSTPLFQKIINPLELLKSRPPPKKKVNYRGFDQLNDKQKQVLLNTYSKIIDETTPNITLIKGPPGTGKSCVIVNLALQTLYGEEVRYLDKKILICAQSNAAVDVITHKLYDISMRMRIEKRFRLIRYGMLEKMNPNVYPVALQNVVQHDQLKKLQDKNKNIQLENKENLKNQILQFEAQIAEMSSRNIKGTVDEDVLIEKKRQLQLMRNILNESMRPEDERSLYTWYLSNANIVCATLSSSVNLAQYINFFDICIIDEATQCTEPWTLMPLKFGINSLVLVGDTQQLPATVLSKKANELGLGTSMFTRIQHCLDNIPSSSNKSSNTNLTTPNSIICGLQTQYRMHPEICRWPNQYFYRNELINGKTTIDFTKSPLLPFSILNLSYTQHNSCSNGKITNNLEAEFVAKLLKALDGFIPNKYNSYGVITPYAHHRATLEGSIRSLGLTNIMVNTIDSYQGLEKDVIVISNARTHGIGFLSNPQRLNVALTRSKKCLILCGNFKNLETVPAWRCLLESARERKVYYEISANCIADIQTNVIDKIKLKNQIH